MHSGSTPMYVDIHCLDWDIQRRGEYNHPEPNPQQNIPLYLSSTQVSFWHTGCLVAHMSPAYCWCCWSGVQGGPAAAAVCQGQCDAGAWHHAAADWHWADSVLHPNMESGLQWQRCLSNGCTMHCVLMKFLDSPSRGLKMEIVFKRRLTNELLTTYLPSLLLLLMSYATTYFKPFYFEAAVTVNLSILLVTTTLFIRWLHYYIGHSLINIHHRLLFSVMEKLPATSYVRLVDVWLIFGQLLPFIEGATFFTPDFLQC